MKQIGLQSIIQLLREKEKLTINPQYVYNMRHIVMALNNSSIDTIKQQFQLNDNRLDLKKFLWLMRNSLPNEDQSSVVCYELVKLFEEIDIDSSKAIEWGQFLEYLSQSTWLSPASLSKQSKPTKETSVLVHAFNEDAKYRKHTFKKVIEMSRHRSLALLTNNNSLSFLSFDKSHKQEPHLEEEKQRTPFTLGHVDCNRILSIDYSEEERLFGILLTNRNLCFIEDGQMQKNFGIIRSSGNEVDIRYLSLHKLWVLQSVNSTLQVFTSPKSTQPSIRTVFRPHQSPITSVRQVKTPLTLCTASLDGVLKLWNLTSGRLVIELDIGKQRSEQRRKGIKGMATCNRGSFNYICTWMFTTQIFVWLPSLSLSKPFVGELQGHLGIVTDSTFAWRGELVSIDDKRNIRVWNLEKLQCLQSFTVSEENSSLLVLRAQPYLIIYSRLLDFYRIRTNSKADLQSQVGAAGKDGKNVLALGQGNTTRLIAVLFSHYYCYVAVVTTQQAKILDINSSNLISAIRPPNGHEYISATLKSNRRIVLGTSLGSIFQYKLQDGQLVRRIQVCQDDQQLKFLYFHQETKILLTFIEFSSHSTIISYDLPNSQQALKIKQIQFDQLGLQSFQTINEANNFFILSVDLFITVWDYDKLTIINKIDLQMILKPIIFGNVTFYAEPINKCLLIQSGNGIGLINIDNMGIVGSVTQLDLGNQQNQCTAAALLLQKIPNSFLQQQKSKQTKREMRNSVKKVGFQMFQKEDEVVMVDTNFQDMFILAVANKKGEIYYFKLNQLLRTFNIQEKYALKGKMQRVKQHRKAHMKSFIWSGKRTIFDCNSRKFSEQYTLISNVQYAGSSLSLFYYYTSENMLYFSTAYGQIKGEWALSLSRPKLWSVSYNEIEEVLGRLERTVAALVHVIPIDAKKFKVDFLIAKYLSNDEVYDIQKNQQKTRKQTKSTAFLSNKRLDSRKSIVSINQNITSASKLKPQGSLQKPAFRTSIKKNSQNVFQKKLQGSEKNRLIFRKSKELFLKVQRSISYCKMPQVKPSSAM